MAPMKIVKALKKKALQAMKCHEESEVDNYDDFAVYVEYLNGGRVFVSNIGGVRRSIKNLEWWILYGRGEVRDPPPRSCTFVYKGKVLNARRTFLSYGIQDSDVLQVIIE